MDELKVPVDGKLEPFNPEGQSDGSVWTSPKDLIPKDHEHFFKMTGEREARCECGFGGALYPHQGYLKDGHIFNLKNEKVV